MYEVIFDVETKNLFRDVGSSDPASLGISIVSLYRRHIQNGTETDGEMLSFWESDLPRMWEIFRKADRIIGFNTLKFDIPALSPYAPADFHTLQHFDILDKVKNAIGIRLSLNSLAKDTIGHEKTDSGTNAVIYWNNGDTDSLNKLKFYCEADVALTRDLYDFGYSHGHLKYTDKWNNMRNIDLDFSYPAKLIAEKNQIRLF